MNIKTFSVTNNSMFIHSIDNLQVEENIFQKNLIYLKIMTMEKSVNIFGLFIVLSLLIIFNEYINVQIIEYKNFKCFLIHSINTISIVRFLLKFQHKKRSPLCRTI